MKAKRIKLTLNELNKMIEYKNGVMYCQAIRKTDKGYTVGFYNPRGYPLWPTAVKELKYQYEIHDAVVSLGNEIFGSEHLLFKDKK